MGFLDVLTTPWFLFKMTLVLGGFAALIGLMALLVELCSPVGRKKSKKS